MGNFQELRDKKLAAAAAERKRLAEAKPQRAVDVKEIRARRRVTGRKLTDAEAKAVTSAFRCLQSTTTHDLMRAAEIARREEYAAESPPPAVEETVILQVGSAGSDTQIDYELMLDFAIPYERERAWPSARPGWGTLDPARIDPWRLCRRSKPVSLFGHNLTTDREPQLEPGELLEATARLQRSLGELEALDVIVPGPSSGSWRVFYGRSTNVGSALEKDPQSAVASRKPPVSGPGR
jgi:hypothetical protein